MINLDDLKEKLDNLWLQRRNCSFGEISKIDEEIEKTSEAIIEIEEKEKSKNE